MTKQLKRDESTYVPPTDPRVPLLRELCHLSKNLYNACLYDHRQRFFDDEQRMDSCQTQRCRFVDENNPDYRALPAKVSGEVVQEVGRCFKSFFALKKKQREGLIDASQRIYIPGYLDKDGMHTISFPKDALIKNPIHRKDGLWEQVICQQDLNLHVVTTMRDVTMIRIQPQGVGFRIHAIYKEDPLPYKHVPDNGRYASIDLGVDNLMAVFINDVRYKPFIIPGGYLKSVNQWWNRIHSLNKMSLSAQYKLPNHMYQTIEQVRKETGNDRLKQDPRASIHTKRMRQATLKRKHIIDWQAGNITTFLANYLASIGISRVVIGLNPDWKQNANMGRRTNQNFVQLPFTRFISMLEDKLTELGIRVTRTEESYTSKASFIDHDRIGVYGKTDNLTYSGRRNERGQYTTRNGIRLNADINGAANIMRKVIPDRKVYLKGIETLAVGPVRHMNLTKQGKCTLR